MINAGERLIVNNKSFGYLSNRIVFYLLNLHIKTRRTYFARVGEISDTVNEQRLMFWIVTGWCLGGCQFL